jgi:5'-nucleotidase
MTRPRALITNDDGIDSVGLHRLAALAVESGFDVVVAAPRENFSGASASLAAVQAGGRLEIERRVLPGLEDIDAYSVAAAPAFLALLGGRGAFGPAPEVVLSGINLGHNAGQAVLHSGTVGAALTAGSHGSRAMAVSLVVDQEPRWDTAVAAARPLLPKLLEAPARTVLNLNAPDVPVDALRGLRAAKLASFGAVQTNVTEHGQGFIRVEMADVNAELEEGTDAAFLADGWATVTTLEPICETGLGRWAADLVDPGLAAERSR